MIRSDELSTIGTKAYFKDGMKKWKLGNAIYIIGLQPNKTHAELYWTRRRS